MKHLVLWRPQSSDVIAPNCRIPRPSALAGPGLNRRRTAVCKCGIVIALVLLCQMLSLRDLAAQNSATCTITGTVTDPSGNVIPSAAVLVENEATHIIVAVKTTNAGDYSAPFLPPGSYQVTVTQSGFETFERSHIDLLLDQTVRVDAHLKLGASSEQVTVTTSSVSLDTESSQMETNFSSQVVQDLPIEGRFLEVLDQLVPGVSTAQSSHLGENELNTDERMNVQGSRAFS